MKIALDKRLHLAVGLVVFAACMLLGLGHDRAALAVCLVAIGKEVYDADRTDRHTPDVWDTLATVIPAMAGWGLFELRALL